MEIEQLDGSADLAAARDALEEHRWREAFDLLARADREGRLGATDLEALAQAAWFIAQPDLAVEAKERAFKAYFADGKRARAAKTTFELSREYVSKRKFSIASAWAARGERLLEGEPEGFAHGYQALSKSLTAEHAGDVETAIKRRRTDRRDRYAIRGRRPQGLGTAAARTTPDQPEDAPTRDSPSWRRPPSPP